MSDSDEFIADFLEECAENLDQLEQELVALEDAPADADRLQSIFRTIHTIKGSSGFFGFSKLGALTHDGETLLGLIRDGRLPFNQPRASALLKMSDAVRELMTDIESTGSEGPGDYSAISTQLQSLTEIGDEADETIDSDSTSSTDRSTDTGTAPQDEQQAEESNAPEARPAEKVETETALSQPVTKPSDTTEAAASKSKVLPSEPPPPESSTGETLEAEIEPESKIEPQPEIQPQPVIEPEMKPEPEVKSETESKSSKAKRTKAAKSSTEATSIRVDVSMLNELMDLAGELVLARNELSQDPLVSENRELSMMVGRLSQVTSMLQDRVMRTRMQPISIVFSKFNRIVRDLAVDCDKQIRLVLEGEETELDRTLLDAIRDPLTHIIRNSVDHGIEKPDDRIAAGKPGEGTLLLRASHQSGQVVIEAIDDGGGIDVSRVREKAISKGMISAHEAAHMSDGRMLQLIFAPGFSTAQNVSSISGRGVGMDVVRNNIERIGGSVDLISKLGIGTTLRITIPLTLAIVPSLTVQSANQNFVIPQASLQEVILVDDFERLQDVPVYRLRDQLLPLVWLDEILQLKSRDKNIYRHDQGRFHVDGRSLHVAVLEAEDQRFGLVVDEVQNSQEVVVKPIGALVKSINAYSASTLLGDGSVALILDVGGIAKRAGFLGRAGEAASLDFGSDHDVLTQAEAKDIQSWLVCTAGNNREVAIALDSIERLHELSATDIEPSEAGWFTSYCGDVLPLISLGHDFSVEDRNRKVPVIVHRRGDQLMGAAVGRVVDVIESDHVVTPSTKTSSSAVIGLTIAGGRPIEVVDLNLLH